MKKLRKAVSILLALVMILGMTGTAMADTTYTITITGGKSGHTYEAYQIFTGTLDTNGDTLSDVVWGNGVNSANLVEDLIEASNNSTSPLYKKFPSKDGDGNTIAYTAADIAEIVAGFTNDSDEAEEFAQIASDNLSTTVAGTSTEESSPYTISGLDAGYYLVKDKDDSVQADGDAYTDIILKVVSNVEVAAKTEYTVVTKEVDKESEEITGEVTYTLTGSVPDTSAYSSYTYIFHDTLSDGLTYVANSLKVTVDNVVLTEGKDYDYTLTVNGQTITVEMNDAKALSEKDIIVTYKATLNSKAYIGNATDSNADEGNVNKVYVEYSNNPNGDGTGKTTTEEVVTFTFELDVTKVDADTEATLEGAEFVLYKEDNNGTPYYVQVDSTSSVVTGWTTTKNDASTLESDSNGNFSIIGLSEGIYYLEETKAPDGYNSLSGSVKIEIIATYSDTDSDGLDEVTTLGVKVDDSDISYSTDNDRSSVDVTVENNAGATLPSTGGIGTTIFYVVGGILVVAAAVLLITKGRMSRSE